MDIVYPDLISTPLMHSVGAGASLQETYFREAGIYIRPMVFSESGSRVSGHVHNFGHLTLFTTRALAWFCDIPENMTEQSITIRGGER